MLRFKIKKDNIKDFLDNLGVSNHKIEIPCEDEKPYSLSELIELFEIEMVDLFNNMLIQYEGKIKEMIYEVDIMADVKNQKIN